MSLFLTHTDFYNRGDPEEKAIEVVTFISKYFNPSASDSYYIMDPYLNVIQAIQNKFRGKIDEGIWSMLIDELAFNDTKFDIITREAIDGLVISSKHPPYSIPFRTTEMSVAIRVCKYVDTKYCGMGLHDRYILRENNDKPPIGIHIGPSLGDIHDKDVSITFYDVTAADLALKSFKTIWDECVKNKEWKSN